MKRQGFTLLEVLVATLVMAIAVTGLLSSLQTSLRHAARLREYDRATMLARQKMDELLIAKGLPKGMAFQGTWDASVTAGEPMGWMVKLSPFEAPPHPGPGTGALERIELQIWWMSGEQRKTFELEGFRRVIVTPEDLLTFGNNLGGAAPQ